MPPEAAGGPALPVGPLSATPLPVTLLTGFLGSGKTTLLRRVLSGEQAGDTAVLVNEFGEIGLDQALVAPVAPDIVLLPGGCVCCTVRGELRDALVDLLDRRAHGAVPPFRRILVETTGLADPLPLLTTLAADPVLRHAVRFALVATVVDAAQARTQAALHPEWIAQVAAADRLLLAKEDLAATGEVASLRGWLAGLNPEAQLLSASDPAALDADATRGSGSRRSTFVAHPALAETPHGLVTTVSLRFDGQLDWTGFGLWLSMLLAAHGDRVLRVKGILHVAGSAGPVAIHGVQHLVHPPEHNLVWSGDAPHSRLVFILRGMDRDTLLRSLRSFTGLPAPVE